MKKFTLLFGKYLLASLFIISILTIGFLSSAHASSEVYSYLDETIASYSLKATGLGTLLLFILAFISLSLKKPKDHVKEVLFVSMTLVIGFVTVFLAGSTIYLNTVSNSKGPVHWHADIEVWACGQELDFKNPQGWSNKIGTATLHEHNDKRIHLEGVVVENQDASLGKFFTVIGGTISSNTVILPTIQGTQTLATGSCPDGTSATPQVFVYKVKEDKTYYQEKLIDPASYVISPHSQVPPGDCVIVEYGEPKDKTDKLCLSFKVAKEIGKLGEEVTQRSQMNTSNPNYQYME